MTSLKIIEEQINRFLENETPEVIAIRGAWGTGKTYAWNMYLRNAQSNAKVALDKYSYVSLFGINSLDELKFSIFANCIETEQISSDGIKTDVISNLKKAIPCLKMELHT